MPGPAEPLTDIAASSGWLELGTRLDAAMEAHASYGLPRPEDVLKEIARLRGQTSVSVRDAVLAARYARKHFSAHISNVHEPPLGVSNVKQLALLGDLEGPEVDELRERVIEGTISFRALAREVERIRANAASIPRLDAGRTGRLQTIMKSREFDEALQRHIEYVYITDASTKLTISKSSKLGFIPVDFIIYDDGRPAIAIQVKNPREALHERMLIENLGLCLLARQQVPEAWFVTPVEWRDQTERIEAISASIGITGIRFMTFDPATAETGDAAALEEIRMSSHQRLDRLDRKKGRPSD